MTPGLLDWTKLGAEEKMPVLVTATIETLNIPQLQRHQGDDVNHDH